MTFDIEKGHLNFFTVKGLATEYDLSMTKLIICKKMLRTFKDFGSAPVTLDEGHLTLHALKGLAQNTNVPPFIPAVMTESMEKMQTFEFFEVSYQPLRQ